jgi:nucleotide-binding universal stress UspA family protein
MPRGHRPAEFREHVTGAETSSKPIVVGVDGSPAARAVFGHALEEAIRRRAPLHVVSALPMPEFRATTYAAYVDERATPVPERSL